MGQFRMISTNMTLTPNNVQIYTDRSEWAQSTSLWTRPPNYHGTESTMTGILPPHVQAMTRASQAQAALTSASSEARQPSLITPADPNRIGIPELSGPDTPDNPWYVGPDATAPATGLARAAIFAKEGIGHIDAVLALGTQLSTGVRSALTNAKDQAEHGVSNIGTGAPRGKDGGVAIKFDAAGLWLDLARNLIQLEHRGTVTILPVDPPTAGPTNPDPGRRIQLPSPDSPIQ